MLNKWYFWPSMFTLALLGGYAALGLLGVFEESQIPECLSSLGSLLATLWLIGGLILQHNQLQLQADEIKRISQHNALNDTLRVLEDALIKLEEAGINVKSPAELTTILLSDELKIFWESDNPQEVLQAHLRWMRKEAAVRNFLRSYTFAAKIYFEGHRIPTKKNDASDVEYFEENQSLFYQMPYLSDYIGIAHFICLQLKEINFDIIRLAGFVASNIVLKNEFHTKEVLKEMYEKLQKLGKAPAICKQYNFN